MTGHPCAIKASADAAALRAEQNSEFTAQISVQFCRQMRWMKIIQYLLFALYRNVSKIWFIQFFPFLGAGTFANFQIDLFGLHQGNGLVMPEIMPGPAYADISHDLHIQRYLIHLNPSYTTHAPT